MGEIGWSLSDPVVEKVSFSRDAASFWNVSVTLQEGSPGSLKERVVRVKLIDQTRTHGTKEAGQILWPAAGSRAPGQAARTTLTFNTASASRPDHMKVEIEIA
jgi:hypothetical protein